MISIFGQLEKIDAFSNLDYKYKGTIIRALKAAASTFVGILALSAAAGELIPVEWGATAIVITAGLQALDKYLRESQAEKEFEEGGPLTDTVPLNDDEVGVDPEDNTFDAEVVSETASTEGEGLDTP